MSEHFVRFGAMGFVGRFQASDFQMYPRGTTVVCRTERGLEIGDVLNSSKNGGGNEFDGQIVRPVGEQDRLLLQRLNRNRKRAIDACTDFIAKREISTVLLDVEHLFDGQNLYFYFLGSVPPELEALTVELAEVYEAKARFRKFSETLVNGCGPDCGTADKSCGSCGNCAIAGACGTGR